MNLWKVVISLDYLNTLFFSFFYEQAKKKFLQQDQKSVLCGNKTVLHGTGWLNGSDFVPQVSAFSYEYLRVQM